MNLEKLLRESAFYSIGIVVAFAIAGLSLFLMGHDVLLGYYTLFFTSFGSFSGISLTILKFIPLLLMGLGFAIPLSARKYNVGIEGQFLLGAVGAVTVVFSFYSLPGPLLIFMMLIGSIVFGALWAAIPAYMLYKFKVNEIISTILLNFISFLLVNLVAMGPWRDVFAGHPMTLPIPEHAVLPLLVQNPSINVGFTIAIFIPLAVFFYLNKTVQGFELRAVGANPRAATIFGIRTNLLAPFSLIIGGILGGLAGGLEVAGLYHRLIDGLHSNYGPLAILVALIGRGHPVGVVLASLFISVIEIGASGLQRTMGVPVELIFIIEALMLVFILVTDVVRERRK